MRLQLAITQLSGLIARHRRQIASPRYLITRIGRLDAPAGAVLALLSAAITHLTRRVMNVRVAAVHEVAIAGRLIAIRSCLLSTRRGLIALRPLPISIRERPVRSSSSKYSSTIRPGVMPRSGASRTLR